MKAKYIIASLVAACALAIGCTKEGPTVLDEVQVTSSYIGLTNNDGANSKTIKVTAKDTWSIDAVPEWLTISPMSGSAGETTVTFSAEKASATREGTIEITCAGKKQTIIIKQQAEKVEPRTLTVAEAIEICNALADKEIAQADYRIKGIVCNIVEISTQYGNATFWISDDGKFVDGKRLEVYRALWLNGAAVKEGDSVDVGDEVIIEGKIMKYGTTPETAEKQAFVYQINKSLIKCDSLVFNGLKLEALPLEGGEFEASLVCKGNGVSVVVPDDAKSWLSVTGIVTSGDKATVHFAAAENKGGDRSTSLTFTTTDGTKDYSAQATVAQKGAILEVSIADFNAAPVGDTQYRISGIITSIVQDSEQYGANLYIKDATGETYIYGTTDATGTVKTLASFGAKEGDIIEFVGKRAEYKGNPQIAKAVYQWHKSVTPTTAAEVAALADDDKNDPQNYIKLTGKVQKNSGYDIAPYGNFDLVDDSGSILVYGVSTGWKGETKKFDTLGVNEGDIITIIAYKTSYKSNPQVVGMYVSHEAGETPEPPTPPTPEISEYSIDLVYEKGENSYDDGIATINDVENQKVLKIGKSSAAGSMTFTVPAGAYGVSFYAIAWKDNATTLEFKVGDQVVKTQDIAANAGATGNSPYTITVADTDKYEINLGGTLSADTKVTVTTAADAKLRAIFFGVKALTNKD